MRRTPNLFGIIFSVFSLKNLGEDNVLRTAYSRTTNNSNTPTGEHVALLGKVGKRAEVRPVESDQYMTMKKDQFAESQKPKRTAMKISIKKNIYAPIRNHAVNIKRDKQKKLMGKKIRGSEDDVTRMIFDLFSKHEYISLAALEHFTQQPKTYLQQLLKKYCNYNNSVKLLSTLSLCAEFIRSVCSSPRDTTTN